MKKDVLITYVSDLLKSAERNLTGFTEDRKTDSLHRLRVDLKKIRAAYSFAEFAFKKKFTIKPLKPLFKDAGRIREVQVNISLLSSFPHPPKRLIAKLKKEEDILTEAFVEGYLHHLKCLKDFRKKYSIHKKAINNKKIINYFDKMKEVSLNGNNADDMHKYRIRIKRMMHVYYMLPKKNQEKVNLTIESIEKLQQELGEWHDIHTAVHFVTGELVPKKAVEHVLKLKEDETRHFNALYSTLAPSHLSLVHSPYPR